MDRTAEALGIANEPVAQGTQHRPPVVSRVRSLLDSRQMLRDPIQVFDKYTTQLGDTFVFYFGGMKPAIVSSNPAVMQHVLKTNYKNYYKSEIQVKRMGHFLGKGLLTTHGKAWQTQRRLIQRGFTAAKLASLASLMQQSLQESLEQFDSQIDQGVVNICPEMTKITFRMVARSLFSASIKDEDIDYISQTISTVQEFMVRQIVQPYLDLWFAFSGQLRKHERMRERGDAVILDCIKKRSGDSHEYEDLLQILLDAVYSDTGKGMSDESILSESMQLLVAGHETSSNALSWMFCLLSQHPEHIAEIRKEYDRVAPDSLQHAELPKLEFTTQIVSESLRLYPPFWMVDRLAIADDQIQDLQIPKGTMVIVFIYGAHHSPKLWVNPESFIPERFSKQNRKDHIPFAYLPFGGGPRGCIGENYAMLQMLMVLGLMLRKYDFELASGQTISAFPRIILKPKKGIRMAVTMRNRPRASE